jgi:hypothetical protein
LQHSRSAAAAAVVVVVVVGVVVVVVVVTTADGVSAFVMVIAAGSTGAGMPWPPKR